MILSREWLFAPLILSALGLALLACNSTDSERFNAQRESYVFDTTSTTLTAFGASRTDDDPDSSFRCPNVSGMSGETSLTVFNARANALLPHFTIKSVAGIRGDAALAARVDDGSAAVAFSMEGVTVEEMMAIADAGQVMPPKSTWFEPKLRSGLFVHVLD